HLIRSTGRDWSMEDIAAASGTSKSIVHRYFTDKAHLQRTLGRSVLWTMHRKLLRELKALESNMGREPDADERIQAMIRAYVETAQRSPGVYRFVTRPSDGLNHLLEAVARRVTTVLPEQLPAPQLWAQCPVGFVEGAVDTWMAEQEKHAAGEGPAPITSEQLVNNLVTWLMKGMHA